MLQKIEKLFLLRHLTWHYNQPSLARTTHYSGTNFMVPKMFEPLKFDCIFFLLPLTIVCIKIVSGIAMLCFALYMTARMGIFQEQIYTRFGKHPREALFYNVSHSFIYSGTPMNGLLPTTATFLKWPVFNIPKCIVYLICP